MCLSASGQEYSVVYRHTHCTYTFTQIVVENRPPTGGKSLSYRRVCSEKCAKERMSSSGAFETVYQTVSVLSALGSFVVVLTGLVFPALLRHRLYHIVFFLNVCQLCVSLSGSLGDPSVDDSARCGMKSLLWVVFAPSAWLWNLLLIASLRDCILQNARFEVSGIRRSGIPHGVAKGGVGNLPPSNSLLSFRFMHFLVWAVAVGFATIPLAYDLHPLEVSCSGVDRTGYEFLYGTSFSILGLCLILSLYLLRSVYNYLSLKERITIRAEINTLKTFQMYNIVLILTWLALVLSYVVIYFVGIAVDGDDNMEQFEEMTTLLPTLLGLWNGMIFLRYSREARGRWIRLCKQRGVIKFSNSSFHSSYSPLNNEEGEQVIGGGGGGGGGRGGGGGGEGRGGEGGGSNGQYRRTQTDSNDLIKPEKDVWLDDFYDAEYSINDDDKEETTSRFHTDHQEQGYDAPSTI